MPQPGDDRARARGRGPQRTPHQPRIDVVVGKQPWQARAEPIAGSPPIVLARDLVLLKLYAGGAQDLWDVRELLALEDAASLRAAVTADIATLSKPLQERWAALQSD